MPREDVDENSNPEATTSNFWDTVDIKPKNVTMALIDCPHCQRRLRVPEDYVGRLTCASCSKQFHRQNEQYEQNQNNLYDSKGRVSVVTDAQRRKGLSPGKSAARFAFGGGLEILISAILFFFSLIYIIASW